MAASVLRLPAAVRFVLLVLLHYADDDGVCWVSITTILNELPRSGTRRTYVFRTIQLALERLRREGYLTWERVFPGHRYPPTRDNPRGVKTYEGGRVWTVNLAKLEGRETKAPQAMAQPLLGYDLQIVSGYDLQIAPSTDRSLSPSQLSSPSPPPSYKLDLRAGARDRDRSVSALAGARAPGPPPGPETETETENGASETPSAARAELPSQDVRRAGTGPTREKQPDARAGKGGRGHPPRERESRNPRLWEPEELATSREALARIGIVLALASPPREAGPQRRDRYDEIARLRAFEASNGPTCHPPTENAPEDRPGGTAGIFEPGPRAPPDA